MKTREDIRVSIRRILVDYQICDDCDLQKAEDDILGLIEDKSISTDPQQENDYLTRFEVAKIFNVTLTTLHKWSKLGIIHSCKIGYRVLYKTDEINQFIKLGKNPRYGRYETRN